MNKRGGWLVFSYQFWCWLCGKPCLIGLEMSMKNLHLLFGESKFGVVPVFEFGENISCSLIQFRACWGPYHCIPYSPNKHEQNVYLTSCRWCVILTIPLHCIFGESLLSCLQKWTVGAFWELCRLLSFICWALCWIRNFSSVHGDGTMFHGAWHLEAWQNWSKVTDTKLTCCWENPVLSQLWWWHQGKITDCKF